MTDIEALFEYRLEQAETTLADAKKMLAAGVSPPFRNQQSILFDVFRSYAVE